VTPRVFRFTEGFPPPHRPSAWPGYQFFSADVGQNVSTYTARHPFPLKNRAQALFFQFFEVGSDPVCEVEVAVRSTEGDNADTGEFFLLPARPQLSFL